MRDISERKEAAERIAHLAFHDALTGLPNRAVFADHLARTVARPGECREPVAVLCVDLDGFKAVNDIYGHPAGDALLIAAAQRLRAAVRGHELVARLGGDEFAVVQAGGQQPDHAGLLAGRILEALAEPFAIGPDTVRISGSVGVALFPADAADPGEPGQECRHGALPRQGGGPRHRPLLRGGDGRGAAPAPPARGGPAAGDRPRRALPSTTSRSPTSAAARSSASRRCCAGPTPSSATIGPATFIPLAEESGLILKLGEWVLREACAEAARWTPALKLSVNLSPVQFTQGDLAAEVEAVLAETGLDPARLELEVTEGLLIKDAEKAHRHPRAAEGARRADLDGRFRHRLFVAQLFPDVPVRQGQDRPELHPRHDRQPAGAGDHPLGDRPRPGPRNAGGGRRASRPPSSSTRCAPKAATRSRAI